MVLNVAEINFSVVIPRLGVMRVLTWMLDCGIAPKRGKIFEYRDLHNTFLQELHDFKELLPR